jgi:hypothetical protein
MATAILRETWHDAKTFLTASNAAIACLVIMAWGIAGASLHNPAAIAKTANRQYQQQLKAQVQSTDGSPVAGRDPASQGQNSLARAASTPSGTGQRTDTIASNVAEDHSHHADPGVYSQGNASDVAANGCLTNYGIPGEQCVPAYAPNNQPITCNYVRQQFPQGVKVTGTDSRHLDANGDGTACGSGD